MSTRLSWLVLALVAVGLATGGCPSNCPPGAPNLETIRIDFELLSTTSSTEGTVRITGVIQNTGSSAFDSGVGQQSVQLYQGTNFQQAPVAQTDFEDLAAGGVLTVTYETTWSRSTEFPPDFALYINLDPDLFIDGNEANDECPTTDNLLTRAGSEINDLAGWGG